jgi:hypothetical protein
VTNERRIIRPPRVALWVVDLFASSTHAEPLLGDLHEEFAGLVATSGVAAARRWFWRQTVKTIRHLFGAAFRSAPWSIVGGVLLGLLLRRVGLSNPGSVVGVILRMQQSYSNLHYDFYVWLITWGIEIVGVIQSVLVRKASLSASLQCRQILHVRRLAGPQLECLPPSRASNPASRKRSCTKQARRLGTAEGPFPEPALGLAQSQTSTTTKSTTGAIRFVPNFVHFEFS